MITSNANGDSFHALNPNPNPNVNPTYVYIIIYIIYANLFYAQS